MQHSSINTAVVLGLLVFVMPLFAFANYFTLPVDVDPSTDINSWFDHDYPDFSVTGEIYRYDGLYASSTYGSCSSLSYYSGPGATGECISYDGHNGIDFDAATSTDVLAADDGEVAEIYWNSCGGWTMRAWHDDVGLATLYAHIATTTIATTTDTVDRYEHIAEVDSTGSCATGPHLHFGVSDGNSQGSNRIDPFGWASTTATDTWPYNQGYLWTTNPPSLDLTLTTDLVSVWLSDSSGLISDLHSTNDLTDNNTVTLLEDGGKNGDAGDFESSNGEYLSITDASQTGLDLSTKLSIAAWVKIESTGADKFIVAKGDINAATRDVAYGFWVSNTGLLEFRTSDNGTLTSGHNVDIQTSANQVTSTSTTYHVAVTFDVATETGVIYVNGSSVSTTKAGSMGASIRNNADFFSVGTRESNGSPSSSFDGVLHQVAVWDRILSSSEVAELYNSGNGIPFSSF